MKQKCFFFFLFCLAEGPTFKRSRFLCLIPKSSNTEALGLYDGPSSVLMCWCLVSWGTRSVSIWRVGTSYKLDLSGSFMLKFRYKYRYRALTSVVVRGRCSSVASRSWHTWQDKRTHVKTRWEFLRRGYVSWREVLNIWQLRGNCTVANEKWRSVWERFDWVAPSSGCFVYVDSLNRMYMFFVRKDISQHWDP